MIIAQLSDLHLSGLVGGDPSYHQFLACLALALKQKPDYLLLTGDLVNNGASSGYDWLFSQLDKTRLRYFCLAGNHDVTLEQDAHLPHHQRQFFAKEKDPRLIEHGLYSLGDYQLICLNTAVAGKEWGQLSPSTLDWLDQTLNKNPAPTLIAMHHPPIKVGSAWIDALGLVNGLDFLTVVQSYQHAKAILCGHVHQAHTLSNKHIAIHTSPATSRQFLPFSEQFALDNQKAGIRLFSINDSIDTKVLRLG